MRQKRFQVVRGESTGTTDDRADRWYIQDNHSSVVDRRGPGYADKQEADKIAERMNMLYMRGELLESDEE